jgi:glycine oxidase
VKVAVVGAGVIGYAVAFELSSRGAEVVLLDPAGAGQGATLASAGMLAPYIEGHSDDLLHLGLRSLDQYDGFLARVRADSGRAVESRRCGTLQIARSREEADALEDDAYRLAARGCVSHTFVDADEARRLEPALAADVIAGLIVPEHGYVRVARLMEALQEAVERRGGRVREGRADALEANGTVRIRTATETIECDAAVLAAGSWSGGIALHGGVLPVRPVRGQLVHLKFATQPLSHIVWGGGGHGGGYIVPWEDGSALVGATVEETGFDARVTAAGIRQLLENAVAMLPAASEATFVAARAGLRPATPDELPIIGPSSTMRGVYYATGHYRNGVLLAPLTASIVADLVLDHRECPENAAVHPGRFGL